MRSRSRAAANSWRPDTWSATPACRCTLPVALKGAGGKTRLRITYHYTVPGTFGGRTAWTDTTHGEVYDIAQWYPRMAVYDDVRGWDRCPTSAASSIWNTGPSTIAVTVPADMIVAGSGQLMNPRRC